MTDALTQPVILGRIDGLFGVRGWIKVYSYTEPREAVLNYKDWLLARDGDWQRVELADGKRQGKAVIARLEGIEDRDAAAELIGSEIGVDRDALPEPEEGHYYWADLEGLTVVRRDGTDLGKVTYVMATGANDVLVVDGPAERLIPFVPGTVILDVDLAAGVIRVDWEWD
ncbi:MAG: ribosome maturation factor RimM [Gammaproteobacteria bacterium]|nr:ribosome maturation factor RimM [Gammaproteobacteria bacterium]MDH3849155.1 ribosome maturation factor RimM [Gammaproteobacteria bacterium]MDH3865007.1 ribosome maturation factor RimM [Gammaproteobacteria bacterium]MDH3905605.1 ribosome maturation factor RimM [Gammaproteobacteria bacterium]MDH3954032.1 ribosome maturation factor RimM [Gammaproteobacteria bacterium]